MIETVIKKDSHASSPVNNREMVTTPLSIYEITTRSNNESIGTLAILNQIGTDYNEESYSTPKDELADHLDILEYIIDMNQEVLAEFYAAFHKLGINAFDIKFKLIEIFYLPTSDHRAGDLNLNDPHKCYNWSIDLCD